MSHQNLAGKITTFDLPMEFHLDYLRQMLNSMRNNSNTQALLVSFSSMKEKSMENAKLKGLQTIEKFKSRAKPKYGYVRDIAVQLLLEQTIKQISIVEDTFDCGLEPHGDEPLPHRMFSWTREDFLNRRHAPNCMWIVVLQKSLSAQCLEVRKIRTDLECLKQFVELIFAAFQTENHKAKEHVQKFVEDALAFNYILETLAAEAEENRVTIRKGMETVLTIKFYRRDSKVFDHRTALEEQLVMSNVWTPIEQRYQTNYYEGRTNQHQLRANIIEQKLEQEIKQYVLMVDRENFRSQCVITMLHEEVERYKGRIAIMTERYDKDYEAVNNEISYKKATMEKLKDQRKFYIEQIERFKEELEQSRLRIIFEAEVERERLRKLSEWKKRKGRGRKSRARPKK